MGGHRACTRLAPPLGNQTPITPSNIYFLDNRFHPLATSQKVCDAWRKQSEAKVRRLCARRWSTPGKRQDSARKIWQSNSGITNRLWPVLKAESAELTSLSSSNCRVPSDLTPPSRYWRLSKPPRSPTTRFESKEVLGRSASCVLSEVSSSRKSSYPTSPPKRGMRCMRAP